MLNTKLQLLGRQAEVSAELVSEYTKIFKPVNKDDFISELEDIVKKTCPGYLTCSNQDFNKAVAGILGNVEDVKHAFDDTPELRQLLKEQMAEGLL